MSFIWDWFSGVLNYLGELVCVCACTCTRDVLCSIQCVYVLAQHIDPPMYVYSTLHIHVHVRTM